MAQPLLTSVLNFINRIKQKFCLTSNANVALEKPLKRPRSRTQKKSTSTKKKPTKNIK